MGSGPLRNAGSKSKVQLEHRGWSLDSKKKNDAMLEKKDLFQREGYKRLSNNADDRIFTGKLKRLFLHGMTWLWISRFIEVTGGRRLSCVEGLRFGCGQENGSFFCRDPQACRLFPRILQRLQRLHDKYHTTEGFLSRDVPLLSQIGFFLPIVEDQRIQRLRWNGLLSTKDNR